MFSRIFLSAVLVGLVMWFPAVLPGLPGIQAQAGVRESRRVYQRKAWEVRVVAFDDGSFACVARVNAGSSNFLIWADPDETVSLQFYNRTWRLGNEKVDIVVRIDRRPKWTLNQARLTSSSVFFTLPDSKASLRFLREIMAGNRLSLYGSRGSRINSYTLAGSRASMLMLIRCVKALKGYDSDNNPFN